MFSPWPTAIFLHSEYYLCWVNIFTIKNSTYSFQSVVEKENMLLYLGRKLFLVYNENTREGSNAQLLMFWRFKYGNSQQSYSSNLIYCFHVPILNTSTYFYSKKFSRNKNRSASLLKAKVYIIPVGKSEVQEKHRFPFMLYNTLLYS